MASSETISANLNLTESKKNSLRKALLLLTLEWRDFDEHLDLNQRSFQESFNALELREKNLSSIHESIVESNKELDSIRESIEHRFKQVENKEKEFHAFQEDKIEELKSKENQLSLIRKSAEVKIEEFELSEAKLVATQKLVERIFEKLELEKKQFESIQKLVDERFKEINAKKRHCENKSKELDLIQNWIERRSGELDAKEEQFEERLKKLELKENNFELMQKLKEERKEELELKEKKIEEREKELDSREKQLDSVKKFTQECFKEFQTKKKQLHLEEKLFEERFKEIQLKERQIDDRVKELELKGIQFSNSDVKAEPIDNMPVINAMDSSSADIRLFVSMDGNSLQIILNEREKDHDSMSDEVYQILRLSLDPAKLVLDAMEGFYPPHLKKGDMEFEGSVARRSCILLLEQLMRISPVIRPHVREEALKLAADWKTKMVAVAENSLEVLGFLHLLASYGLTYAFDTDELLNLFEIAVEHTQIPQLCRILGFEDKIPDLVQNLVKRKQHLVAVRFICAFGLVDKFPTGTILNDYLKHIKRIAKDCYKKESNWHKARDVAIDKRVDAIRTLIRFIVDHKLDSLYSSKFLEKQVEQFLVQKAKNKHSAPVRLSKAQKQQNNEKKQMSSTPAPIPNKDPVTALAPPKAVVRVLGPANDMAVVLANMDGKNLLFFLNEHLEEHELIYNEIYVALQMSFDSAKLVLHAIQEFYPPHSKQEDINFEANVMKSCILLLEQLMRLSPTIETQVKDEASRLALDWKEKIRPENKNPLATLGFLQLVGTYGLASDFDAAELLSLYKTVAQHRHVPELCQALCFLEKMPVNKILQSQVKIQQSSSEDLLLQKRVVSRSMGYRHQVESFCTNMDEKGKEHDSICSEVPKFIHCSLDPAKLVLDALQGWYRSKLKESKKWKLDCFKSSSHLLRHLKEVRPLITSHIKENAMEFAVDWKAKLAESGLNPSEVFGFLQLLATYKLASSFDADELVGLLDIVHQRKQATNLFLVLGLADKVPGFIRNLIKKEQRLQAIRYIYAFELVKMFPPVPLLKNHVTYSEQLANKLCKEGHNSIEVQNRVRKNKIASLKAVIGCVVRHGLESEYSTTNLRARIAQLERQKLKRKILIPSITSKAQLQHQETNESPDPVPVSAPASGPVPMAQPPQQDTRKRPASSLPSSSSVTQSQQQQEKKRRQFSIPSEAVPNAQGVPAYPVHSMQESPRYPRGFFCEQSGPYSPLPTRHYSLGTSTHVTPHMSHSAWQYGSDVAAHMDITNYGYARTHFGVAAANMNAHPSLLAKQDTSTTQDASPNWSYPANIRQTHW